MNDANPDFYDLVTSAVTSAVSDAWAHEEDKQRGNALADLDQTRTAFASDVIPEFCTPLSRTPGPVEDALAAPNEPLLSLQREQTKIIYGNVLRSPRQINNLPDISRIEVGRVLATYEPTTIANVLPTKRQG